MKILVAVLTYQREAQLQECLGSIREASRHAVNALGLDQVDIIIADNDPDSQLVETYVPNCRRMKTGLKSVAGGRQFLLEKARSANYDFLAFIDDDELVSVRWLTAMLQTAVLHKCAGVAGPVLPLGLKTADIPLHTRRRHKSGTHVRTAGAGNLVLNLREVRSTNFDTEWDLFGGEDTDFTARLSQEEGPIVWCDEGEVYEPVAPQRRSRRWLIRRYFMNGRILCKSDSALAKTASFSNVLLRCSAVAASTARLILLPASPWAFRFFLDQGIRNVGYIYQRMVTTPF